MKKINLDAIKNKNLSEMSEDMLKEINGGCIFFVEKNSCNKKYVRGVALCNPPVTDERRTNNEMHANYFYAYFNHGLIDKCGMWDCSIYSNNPNVIQYPVPEYLGKIGR